MRFRKMIVIALSAFLATFVPTLPQNFSVLFSLPQVSAQTANNQINQNSAVSGSFIDYFAEERQFKSHKVSKPWVLGDHSDNADISSTSAMGCIYVDWGS
ncbi:hypothetical protein JYQ62_15855 [Nostoc sp. UHCC 0702]|nr:hypothetical protein JYQ62_15855 [Nostoc sp. UHCC 0702]